MPNVAKFDAYGISPKFLVSVTEPGLSPKPASLVGLADADTEIRFHTRTSVQGQAATPLLYKSNYQRQSLPDLLFHDSMYVVSSALRDIMEPWLRDYEFLPTRIELSQDESDLTQVGGGDVVEDYWWLNCWRNIDVIDWDHSALVGGPPASGRFKDAPIRANGWHLLVLRAPIPADAHFFGLAGIHGAMRYISPALFDSISRARLRVKFGLRPCGDLSTSETMRWVRTLNGRVGAAS